MQLVNKGVAYKSLIIRNKEMVLYNFTEAG